MAYDPARHLECSLACERGNCGRRKDTVRDDQKIKLFLRRFATFASRRNRPDTRAILFRLFDKRVQPHPAKHVELLGISLKVRLHLGARGPFRIVRRHREVGQMVRVLAILGRQAGILTGLAPHPADIGGLFKNDTVMAKVCQMAGGGQTRKSCPDDRNAHLACPP